MKKTFFTAFILSIAVLCSGEPYAIVPETLHYAILMNNTQIGTADISTEVLNDSYITKDIMKIMIGDVINTIEETVVESRDFRPLRTEIINKIVKGDKATTINVLAEFDGNRVSVTTGATKETYILKDRFYLNGNFFNSELMKRGLARTGSISASLYYPLIEIDSTVKVTLKNVGKEKVLVRGKQMELFHVEMYISDVKQHDMYLDESGTAVKSSQSFLNNTIELVLDAKK